jgi:hypothetical protein
MNKNRITNDLSTILSDSPSVLAAYLFGSVVAGIQRESSDVDIAVYLDKDLLPDTFNEVRFRLLDIFENYFDRKVDVVILNNSSLKLIHQVLKYGELIYARESEPVHEFKLKKQKEYFDFKYYIDKDIKQMRAFFSG